MPVLEAKLASSAVCAARSVRKHYGGVQALAGVDLAVYPARFTRSSGRMEQVSLRS